MGIYALRTIKEEHRPEEPIAIVVLDQPGYKNTIIVKPETPLGEEFARGIYIRDQLHSQAKSLVGRDVTVIDPKDPDAPKLFYHLIIPNIGGQTTHEFESLTIMEIRSDHRVYLNNHRRIPTNTHKEKVIAKEQKFDGKS